MYEEFDKFLKSYFGTRDTWYDDGCLIAISMLEEFDNDAWEQLIYKLLTKSLDWQIRFAYILDPCEDIIKNNFMLQSLELLLNIDDDELFEVCIDSARAFKSDFKKICNKKVLNRIKKQIDKDKVTHLIFNDFLSNE